MKRVFLYCLVFLTILSCEKKEDKLIAEILKLDSTITSHAVDKRELARKMSVIEGQLTNSLTKQHKPDSNWKTSLKYFWNSDSSIVMVQSDKKIYKDIKREKILNLNDTAIITLRYALWFDEGRRKLDGTESPGYIFLEEIHYLTAKVPKKILRKMDFDNNGLADTVGFKEIQFTDHTHDRASFEDEIEYLRKIETRN